MLKNVRMLAHLTGLERSHAVLVGCGKKVFCRALGAAGSHLRPRGVALRRSGLGSGLILDGGAGSMQGFLMLYPCNSIMT